MKQYIEIVIECGKKTCASKPGRFCKMFSVDIRGGGNCFLFGRLYEEDGWIMRHRLCLQYAKNYREGNTLQRST